jgi:hypothetical protein
MTLTRCDPEDIIYIDSSPEKIATKAQKQTKVDVHENGENNYEEKRQVESNVQLDRTTQLTTQPNATPPSSVQPKTIVHTKYAKEAAVLGKIAPGQLKTHVKKSFVKLADASTLRTKLKETVAPKKTKRDPPMKRKKPALVNETKSDSDPDFEVIFDRHVQAQAALDPTPPSVHVNTPKPSLRWILESRKSHQDLPRPSIRDPPARTARTIFPNLFDRELVGASWPQWVIHLADNYNPQDISMVGCAPFQRCACDSRGDCRRETCENARTSTFCDQTCCPFGGTCGNGTRTNESLQLMRFRDTSIYAIRSTTHIPAGVVLGEYLGVISLVTGEKKKRSANEGYRLHFHSDSDRWGSLRMCVDADYAGSLMRFLNHSCTPNANFFEVSNTNSRTIVATTICDIEPGEEITVDYGDDLWFDCQCNLCCERAAKPEVKRGANRSAKPTLV